MKQRKWLRRAAAAAAVVAIVVLGIRLIHIDYAHVPDRSDVANPELTKPNEGYQALADEVAVTADTIAFGRKAFYGETFGNEVFFTDIMGMFDGAFSLAEISKATLKLHGRGTDNLIVKAAKTVTIGGETIRKGDPIETGLDVAPGSYVPIGVKVSASGGKVRVGIGCIMCHAVYDRSTRKVVEGVPNGDVNVGKLLALATNSTAFFTHTDIENVKRYMKDLTRTVRSSTGAMEPLPDPTAMEDAVDRSLLDWPRGYVDTMIDLKQNPVQIPDSFTRGDFPYSWNGASPVGPMHGLVFLSGIPNGQNMDPLAQVKLARKYFKLDPDVYMGILLQQAANPKFRVPVGKGVRPTEFFAKVDPTPGADGVNQLVPAPEAGKSSFISLVGMMASKPGYRIAEHLIGLAAYQNALNPPQTKMKPEPARVKLGQEVFRKANCVSCHAGAYYTNNRIIAQEQIRTEPSRGLALKGTEHNWGPNRMYEWDTKVPLPAKPKTKLLPFTTPIEDIKLTQAHGESNGGYKVPSLLGLFWSAPYLHDGGVAVGPDVEHHLGIPGTWYQDIAPDAHNSLRALVDRELRSKVIASNHEDERAMRSHIAGIGHEFWVDDENGFTEEQQEALIHYLLTLQQGK